MLEIRIHGRGGQGSVTAAELLALSAEQDGKLAQAFPNFGVERRGAPVMAYVRISNKFIRTREQIYEPDFLIIQDSTLLDLPALQEGVDKDTVWLVNSVKDKKELKKFFPNLNNVYIIPASEIAEEVIGKNIVNTVLLGAFAKVSGLISLESVKKVVKEYFKEKMDKDLIKKNVKAVIAGYKYFENKK